MVSSSDFRVGAQAFAATWNCCNDQDLGLWTWQDRPEPFCRALVSGQFHDKAAYFVHKTRRNFLHLCKCHCKAMHDYYAIEAAALNSEMPHDKHPPPLALQSVGVPQTQCLPLPASSHRSLHVHSKGSFWASSPKILSRLIGAVSSGWRILVSQQHSGLYAFRQTQSPLS